MVDDLHGHERLKKPEARKVHEIMPDLFKTFDGDVKPLSAKRPNVGALQFVIPDISPYAIGNTKLLVSLVRYPDTSVGTAGHDQAVAGRKVSTAYRVFIRNYWEASETQPQYIAHGYLLYSVALNGDLYFGESIGGESIGPLQSAKEKQKDYLSQCIVAVEAGPVLFK
jgi:hypothetical protein